MTSLLLLAILVVSCSKESLPSEVPSGVDEISVQLSSATFNSSDAAPVEKLDGYLFVNEILVQVYKDLTLETSELELPAVHYDGINASLYMLANTGGVTSPLNDPSKFVIGTTEESELLWKFSGEENMTPALLPLGRKTDLSKINVAEPFQIKLQHAHARLDMKIEEANVEITKIELKNLPKEGSLISDQAQPSDYTGSIFDFTKEYETPATASHTVGYINEGNKLDIPVTVHALFNGIEVRMSLTLPTQIKRNTIYNIKISKVGVTLTATVAVEDWEDGGETEATPDVNAKVLFNPAISELPEGIRYSTTLDTLYIPSSQNSDLVMALNADYEIEAEISGNSSDIKLNPVSGFNRFQMQVNGQQVGSPAYYSYIKVKNSIFENYYGERLVVTVAPNYDAPIADVDLLATVSSIQNSDNLACVLPYGSSITIPAAKIKANNRIFSTVQTLQVLSSPTTLYKAIKVARSSNNLTIESVQNTTGEPQTVTCMVTGTATDGDRIVAIVSLTIPFVPANELAALNSLLVEMGGNTWMQFNTTGTYADDIQNAVAISSLGEITFNKIKDNFTRFGTYKSTYNTANACPPGFRTPSSQEFLNLLGIPDAAELTALGSVASAPVITSGGMTVSYKLLKSAGSYNGEAAISIAKDGRMMYLTNGRFVATPSRTFFEFWQGGSFSIGQAATNNYNWTKRCVQIDNYNGLQ